MGGRETSRAWKDCSSNTYLLMKLVQLSYKTCCILLGWGHLIAASITIILCFHETWNGFIKKRFIAKLSSLFSAKLCMVFWHNRENFRLNAYILNLFLIAQIGGIFLFMPRKNKLIKERFAPFLPPRIVGFFFFFCFFRQLDTQESPMSRKSNLQFLKDETVLTAVLLSDLYC